ncbi:MAG: HAD hydrolase-like protein [Oscillospiraceae bacterium]|nr:HAD hydrolase-like protein [Oscillospiraceae bacterium]
MTSLIKNSKYNIVLFDLDGTISESAEGIRYSLEKTIEITGCKAFDTSNYKLYIGPPLLDTFINHCGLIGEKAAEAVEVYRQIYDTKGKFMNKPYDGIKDVLSKIREAGAKIAVATSKYEKFAEEIGEYLGLSQYIDCVCGSLLDGSRKDKKDIIPYAIRKLGGSSSDKVVMVGDTYFDARGAMLCKVDFVGALYGYGDRDSMEKEGATVFAETPRDLPKFLI